MKKLTALTAAVILAATLTSCSKSDEEIMEEALWSCAEFMEEQFIIRIGVPSQSDLGDIMMSCLSASERDPEGFLKNFGD